MQVIIYPTDGGVAIVHPAPDFVEVHGIEAVAAKDVPDGVPYRIIDVIELPERDQRDAWVLDFTNPDGHGGAAQ